MYSIKAITHLTGLTAETLRAWERRYEGILPARTSSGRREYSAQDLEKLNLLAELTRNGHAISKIVGLDCDALRKLKLDASSSDRAVESLLQQIIDALLEYRIERCESLLRRALLACEPLDYVRDILLPTLKKIGDLWHEGRLNIAQEHIFSNCMKRIVLGMVNQFQNTSSSSPAMLFATPSDEPHEFGILLSCLLAAQLQFRCYYLGADLPGNDVLQAAEHLRPDVIVIGLAKVPLAERTRDELTRILTGNEQDFEIWLGGNGIDEFFAVGRSDNVKQIEDFDHFYQIAQQISLSRRVT